MSQKIFDDALVAIRESKVTLTLKGNPNCQGILN